MTLNESLKLNRMLKASSCCFIDFGLTERGGKHINNKTDDNKLFRKEDFQLIVGDGDEEQL